MLFVIAWVLALFALIALVERNFKDPFLEYCWQHSGCYFSRPVANRYDGFML